MIECKLLARTGFSDLLEAVRQAEANREDPGDIPIAVVKRKENRDQDALVCMRLEEFREYFVG